MFRPIPALRAYTVIESDLTTVCNQYQEYLMFENTHHAAADTIKAEIRDLSSGRYAQESEDFKLIAIQFCVAALIDYLKENSSKKFINLINQLCVRYPAELSTEKLNGIRSAYPVAMLTRYLGYNGALVSDIWNTQGGMDFVLAAYNTNLRKAPAMK